MPQTSGSLWNTDVTPAAYTDATAEYRTAVFEQYKLCVEMADRVSARRNTANTFFLSLNSLIVTALTAALRDAAHTAPLAVLVPGLLVLLAMCAAWFALVRSYRLLNRAKWAVIGDLEARLPAYAFSRGEWEPLDGQRRWGGYLHLSWLEQWVPLIFVFAYTAGFLVLVLG